MGTEMPTDIMTSRQTNTQKYNSQVIENLTHSHTHRPLDTKDKQALTI